MMMTLHYDISLLFETYPVLTNRPRILMEYNQARKYVQLSYKHARETVVRAAEHHSVSRVNTNEHVHGEQRNEGNSVIT